MPKDAHDFDTSDKTQRCSIDQRLRNFGFKIVSRPRAGPAMWERHGAKFTVEQALEIVRREIAAMDTNASSG